MDNRRDILKGILDIHLHTGPSVAQREVDVADMLVDPSGSMRARKQRFSGVAGMPLAAPRMNAKCAGALRMPVDR